VRFVMQAIEYEARRQIGVIEDGGTVSQETRLFDSARGITRPMRSKEEAHDYRYFPDPDLLPLEFDQAYVDALAKDLPELPDDKRARFIADYGLTPYDAGVLVMERASADYFEAMVGSGGEPKALANWLINEEFGRNNKEGIEIQNSPATPQANSAIVQMISSGEISGKMGKDLLDIVRRTREDPRAAAAKHGMKQLTDTGAIEAAVDEVIAANPDKAAQAKEKPTMLGWFVGQVMKQTGGKANPQAVNELLKSKLGI